MVDVRERLVDEFSYMVVVEPIADVAPLSFAAGRVAKRLAADRRLSALDVSVADFLTHLVFPACGACVVNQSAQPLRSPWPSANR